MMDEDFEQLDPGVDRGGFGPAPFDESSTGDCILQTSDGVQYKAHRILLALASPIFRDMWEIGTEDGNIPVVELTESNDVVHNLLLHLYPTTTPSIDNFTLAFGLMDACDKYPIDAKSFFPHLAKIFRSRTFGGSEADVLDAYCLAWRLNMRERAQELSRHLHGLDLTRPSLLHEIDRKAGDVRAILALWDLRYRRETAMDSFLERLPLALYRCPEHLGLTLEEAGRLRQNARKVFTSPWFSHKLSMSECLGLFDVFDTPSEASRPGDVQPAFFGVSRRARNPPCPVCQATIAESRRSNLDTIDHVKRAATELPRAVKWPSDKPAAVYL